MLWGVVLVQNMRIPTPGAEPEWMVLSPPDVEGLTKLGKQVEFSDAKMTVFEQGAEATRFCLLISGIIRVSRILPDGERHVIAFHWPGDIFGLEENGHYLNHAETVTPCVVCEFSSQKLYKFLASHPHVQQAVLVKAIYNLRATQRQLIVVGRLDVHRAMAAFLLDCTKHDAYFDSQTNILTLPMSRYDIADYLGTATESITRAMSKLEGEGLIRRTTPRELVLNLSGLKNLADLD